MAEGLLAGLRVLDLAGEPAAMTGRVLADLGADVVKVEPPQGDSLRSAPPFRAGDLDTPDSLRFEAWNAGKRSIVVDGPADPQWASLLGGAHVIIDTPGHTGAWEIDESRAPHASWVHVTPFGTTGPKSGWRASDLGVMASSGNMYTTGAPDKPPVRSSEPCAYSHTGPEAALALLTALASGTRQIVDVSMQETIQTASMCAVGQFKREPSRGTRLGAVTGRSREIWETSDGFVSFGLRGGKARVPSLQLITKLVLNDGIDAPVMANMDWDTYHQNTVTDDDLAAITRAIGQYFKNHTMTELFAIACETNLMLAPTNSPIEIVNSVQMNARNFVEPLGDIDRFPRSFATLRSPGNAVAEARATRRAPALGEHGVTWSSPPPALFPSDRRRPAHAGAWAGTRILEFGSGAAGPIATRYFNENGAIVLRIESRSRPDFLRVYALGPKNPHGLEGAGLFDALNCGKRSITLDLKTSEGIAVAKKLFMWADAVCENFAPKAMRGFGLDYDSMVQEKPDLVMVSACLNGNTGPQKDYPGFGGQGAAMSGFNFVTGWPDREPNGPNGTITDSLAPRFVATALAAGLLHHRRTGRGVYVDISQVEAAAFTLSPWLLDYVVNGHVQERMGNRSVRTVPHGAFPCLDETSAEGSSVRDRWVAIACWTDEEWARLADEMALTVEQRGRYVTLGQRRARIDELEALIADWTRTRTRAAVADRLQSLGIEAVPVQDIADVHHDPQLAHRDHLVALDHPFMGPGCYERNGFRLSDAPGGYDRAGPTLGQDNAWVLHEALGLSDDEIKRLEEHGALDTRA